MPHILGAINSNSVHEYPKLKRKREKFPEVGFEKFNKYRREKLELSRLSELDPQSNVYTNFATSSLSFFIP